MNGERCSFAVSELFTPLFIFPLACAISGQTACGYESDEPNNFFFVFRRKGNLKRKISNTKE